MGRKRGEEKFTLSEGEERGVRHYRGAKVPHEKVKKKGGRRGEGTQSRI